jgi:hypothetical protein
VREHLRTFEDAGVDQVVFIQQGGNNRHEHICASLELFAARVMPEFKARDAARRAAKDERLAPAIARALERRLVQPAPLGELEPVMAYGRNLETGEARYGPEPPRA